MEKELTTKEKLEKLNNYFDKYIDKMIIEDIEKMKARNDGLKFSYPYLLLVYSGIDTFGGIERGFARGNSSERFRCFVTEWMGKINPLYKEESLAYLIYDSWRCGVMHQATLKRGFETSSYKYDRSKHLHYMEDKDRVFIHSLQFADDFIKAQKKYREYINNSSSNITYIDSLYDHLRDMINEDAGRENFDRFTQILKDKKLIFNSSDVVSPTKTSFLTKSTSKSESSSKETTTGPPDDILAIPSAKPEEENL